MRLALLAANGFVLAGIAWMVSFGSGLRASELLPSRTAAERGILSELEAHAAHARTAESVAALATAYLERDQPGLASAAIESAGREVRARPEIAHLEARALFRRGRAVEALAAAARVTSACAGGGCPEWLMARAVRQVAFLEQLVAAGIDDPESDPRAARAAYERSTREVRLVAMR